MKIGIDISQMAYENTGVANYLESLIQSLLKVDDKNQYILFGSSLRQSIKYEVLSIKYKNYKNVKIKIFPLPPSLLDFLWNRLHIVPIEMFLGEVDIFISSDWTQPPARHAKKATILYDLIVYKYPLETDKKIIATQKRKLNWVKKECDIVFCISESTKRDAIEILGIEEKKLNVIYPGV
jgi:glycosyltransferase involved in cell wall biosynthesis